jgi:tight adherence protein B
VTAVAAALAGVAVLLAVRPPASDRLRRSGGRPERTYGHPELRQGHRFRWGAPLRHWWDGRRGRGAALDPAELAEQVAALSLAGLPPLRVWQALAAAPGPAERICAGVAVQLAAGGSAGEALRAAGGPPAIGWLACEVADRAGAPQAEVLQRFATAVRADVEAAADRDTALAGPRATATLLSWLPLPGIGLGMLLGADPLGTLLGTPFGRACLLVGAAFWFTGRRWTAFLIGRAERAADPGGPSARRS